MNSQIQMFPKSSKRPTKSVAWEWRRISASTWECADPRAPETRVYRICVSQTQRGSLIYRASGPYVVGHFAVSFNAAVRMCRLGAERARADADRRHRRNTWMKGGA